MSRHDGRSCTRQLGVVAAALYAALVLGTAPARAASETCTIRYAFGTVRLADSEYAAGRYGADLRLLYGDWDWAQTFGLHVDVIKAVRYVQDIAALVRDCVGDRRAGRLDFSRHQVTDPQSPTPRDETDAEYFVRAFDDLVALRRELAVIEIEANYDRLLQKHAPLVPREGPAVVTLKSIVNATVLRVLERAADRTTGVGWVLVNLQALDHALTQFQEAHTLTRQLIQVYLRQFPEARTLVIAQLRANTDAVIDQYGQFFSPERRAALEALLAQAAAAGNDEDLDIMVADLSKIANDLQTQLQGVWDPDDPLRAMASKLKFIFGRCDGATVNHPLVSRQYFGDLPVAARIVEEGDDASLCMP